MRKIFPTTLFMVALLIPQISMSQDHSQPFNYPLQNMWKYIVESREVTLYNTAIYATPLFDNLKIYLASANGSVTALYKGDRQVSWEFLTSYSIKCEMQLINDCLVVASGADIFSLDKNTGSVKWAFRAKNSISVGIASDKDNSISFADSKGIIYCLNALEGTLNWEYANPEGIPVTSDIFIIEGYLICGDQNGNVQSFRLSDGSKKWTFTAKGAVRSGFCHFEGIVYFGSDDNYVYAVNRTNGSQRWKQRTAGDVRGRPIVEGDHLFISSRDRSIRAIYKHSGSFSDAGVVDLTKNTDLRPIVIDTTMIYVQGKDVSGIGPNNNLQKFGRLIMVSDVTSPPAFDSDEKLLYVGLRNGTLQAITSTNQLEEKRMVKDKGLKVSDPEGEILKIADPGKPKKNSGRKKINNKEVSEPARDAGKSFEKEAENKQVVKPEVKEPDKDISVETEGENLKLEAEAALEKGNYARAAFLFRHLLKEEAESTFTISFGLFCQENSIKSLLTKIDRKNRFLFVRKHQDKVCYFVCTGLYDDKESAEADLAKVKALVGTEEGIKSYRLDSFIN